MSAPYPIDFSGGRRAIARGIARRRDLPDALRDLAPPRPVMVLVGGANSLSQEVARSVLPIFLESLAPVLERLGAAVIDGGTDAGVMSLMGQARAQAGASYSLVGVAARGTVRLPGELPAPGHERAPLEPNHTRFLLVPGGNWGDESPWIVAAASTLAGNAPTATLAIGGGEVTRLDLELSLQAGRRTLLLGGSGGVTEELALASQTGRLAGLGISADKARLLKVIEPNSTATILGDLLRSASSG